jgi:hypothetical protein
MKKIAYLILAHNDPAHFCKLVKSICNNADIYVHVDAKSKLEDFSSQCLPGVTFIPERVNIAWAGISMVDALINLIKAAMVRSELYTHMVFLSGSDYPIKPMNVISNRFKSSPERQFIKYIDMRESPGHYLKLVTKKQFLEPLIPSSKKYIITLDKIIRRSLRALRIPNNWRSDIVPYFGHTWCALTPNCCAYILDFHDSNPWFYQMNKDTFSPDEHYFHTIIGNSPFAKHSDGLQKYEGRGLWRLVNFHLICPSLNKWFTLADWSQIETSEKLFLRKVNSSSGSGLVENIDTKILKR